MGEERQSDRRHVAFRITPAQRQRARAVITAIRTDSTPKAHAEALIDLIVELTEEGMRSYYIKPLERVGVGSLVLNAAKIGVMASEKTLPPLVRRTVASMSDQQLREIVDIIDEMLV
jgi:hypothetical protein